MIFYPIICIITLLKVCHYDISEMATFRRQVNMTVMERLARSVVVPVVVLEKVEDAVPLAKAMAALNYG